MTTPSSAVIAAAVFLYLALDRVVNALGGSSNTIAVVYGAATTICSIVADLPVQHIQCWRNGQLMPPLFTEVSFDAVAGGRDILCGLRSGGFSLICWNNDFAPKRIYNNDSVTIASLAVGDSQICALLNVTDGENAYCWRGDHISSAEIAVRNSRFRAVSSGLVFSCGIQDRTNLVLCWGDEVFSPSIQSQFSNSTMITIQVGGSHACGIDESGVVICKGGNNYGQLDVPSNLPNHYSSLALGEHHSCAIRTRKRTVICWGGDGEFSTNITDGIPFESIVAGLNFTCGLTTESLSVMCWGPGWLHRYPSQLPLSKTLPGPCIDSDTPCPCNVYPDSRSLCSGTGHICAPCGLHNSLPPSPPTSQPVLVPDSQSKGLRNGLLAFAIVGSVGAFAGFCSIMYCLYTGVCFGKKKVHNSVQPTITAASHRQSSSSHSSRSSSLIRQASQLVRRQRSGPSNRKPDKAEEFLFSELAAATDNFSFENRIGAGSFGIIYKGKVKDGREVAIKRSETFLITKKLQEKDAAFDSEVTFLTRVHHKNLVSLVGYCAHKEERLLVYEYMKNGSLYNHLHNKSNVEKSSSVINSWKMRIKISLDAARGIEYLHNYAVPPIIHRDIKSSNILLDVTWTARVSDFGLSLPGPINNLDHHTMKAAGTIGYIDPEYYGLNVLTTKSDVYGLGVVMLELLMGRRAIFKRGDSEEGEPITLVDYAVPAIVAGELWRIVDGRVGAVEGKEAEAVELVAYTAMHCVHLEGKDRPTMTDVVGNLERALACCGEGISSERYSNSMVSE